MGKKELGKLIRRERQRRGIGYYDLAAEIGRTPASINAIENGKVYPSVEVFCRISREIGIDAREMADAVMRDDM